MKSSTTSDFWQSYKELSPAMKRRAKKAYELWQENQLHPSYGDGLDSIAVRDASRWRSLSSFVASRREQKRSHATKDVFGRMFDCQRHATKDDFDGDGLDAIL